MLSFRQKIKQKKLANVADTTFFIFIENHVFMGENDNPVENVVTYEEELDGIEIDGISSLENLPRAVFID